MKNKGLIALLVVLGLALIVAVGFGSYYWRLNQNQHSPASAAVIPTWWDENGHALTSNPQSPRYPEWVKEYTRNLPNAQFEDHGTWWQARIPQGGDDVLVISGAEWGGPHQLGSIDGMVDYKQALISMRDFKDWVNTSEVAHYEGLGTYVTYYSNTTMSGWNVDDATILQFDGYPEDVKSYINGLSDAWLEVRRQWGWPH